MLESFWNSLEVEDLSDLGYTQNIPYPNEDQKDSVMGKINWVILKLYKIKDQRKYDYDAVINLKNRIRMSDCSLSEKGIEFLNVITKDLKEDTF